MSSSPSQTASMGILQAPEAFNKFRLRRFAPSEALAPFVMHHWIVEWDLPEDEVFLQDNIPNPCVNLVAEFAGSAVYGVSSRKYTKRLSGKERAYGVKFRPGGFYPFAGKPLSELTDGSMTFAEAFGMDNDSMNAKLTEALRSDQPAETLIALTETMLMSCLPHPDETVDRLVDIIRFIQSDRTVSSVEQLTRTFDIGVRTLQRLFSKYVGVSPKWVIQLYRLQNAAETLDAGYKGSWASLGAELGFYDQSHFIRSFKAMIGKTPEEYAAGHLL
ncbi:helix-turn-helix domain-containing protein [Paenibacillus agaridevorans]|uniref:helix-turn-helix domain-containing protein n=1 Tax=Paenibacillus agaridevorans TaxID=171404 RepID=UPI001BE40945|nr:AraC family transcriptional regulator [Paenibacillus agaridevorans]